MIHADRFIATSDNRDMWLAARRLGVTATDVRDAATPAGLKEVMQRRAHPQPIEPNAYMQFGNDNEAWILSWAKQQYGIMPSHWLIASEDNPRYLATPDGLSLDHTEIAEVKTGGKEPGKLPSLAHRRQMQWQLRCTGAARCRYVFMLRAEVNGVFVPAWLEPKTWLVERDETLITGLEQTAELLLRDSDELENIA